MQASGASRDQKKSRHDLVDHACFFVDSRVVAFCRQRYFFGDGVGDGVGAGVAAGEGVMPIFGVSSGVGLGDGVGT